MDERDIVGLEDEALEAIHEICARAEELHAGPLSPAALAPAVADVAAHLASSPGYCTEMWGAAARQFLRAFAIRTKLDAGETNHRFANPAWRAPPFSYYANDFLLAEEWLLGSLAHVPGVTPHHAKLAAFAARQWLDAFSPSNLPWMNPEVLQAAYRQHGMNFVRGYEHWLEDLRREFMPRAAAVAEEFVVGRDVAVTAGKVVLRNELIELIQYAPQTHETRPEPLLIVPAWIMKYYILDLSPHNSLIRYLVGRGFTVFCISWRNPGREMAETTFDDYRRLGVMTAINAISKICAAGKIHALGYCLGGTLLSIAAAAMARGGDNRLATMALLAAQTDFSEPGELQIFIDETQLNLLDGMMSRQGYLDSQQMAMAFNMLRARDLVWSRMVKSYLLGETTHPNDLMAWNADATRMPFRMHSTYLRSLFLHNDLAEGRFDVGGEPVHLADIATPVLAVGTEDDHVAPWRSAYKIQRLVSGDVTFLLASGGHNSGIVSEPGHRNRSYRVGKRPAGSPTPAPDDYLANAEKHSGSWWPAYADWLDGHSGAFGPPPAMGYALCDAPGTYALEH